MSRKPPVSPMKREGLRWRRNSMPTMAAKQASNNRAGRKRAAPCFFVFRAQARSVRTIMIAAQRICSTRTKPQLSACVRMASSTICPAQRRKTAASNRAPGRRFRPKRDSTRTASAQSASQKKTATCASPYSLTTAKGKGGAAAASINRPVPRLPSSISAMRRPAASSRPGTVKRSRNVPAGRQPVIRAERSRPSQTPTPPPVKQKVSGRRLKSASHSPHSTICPASIRRT